MTCKFPNLGSTRLSLVVAGLALAATSQAAADVKLEVTNSTYELRGLTREAIHDDLHRVAKNGWRRHHRG
ncbi:hypothetical protein [Mesorhizobium sp. M1396]|uniref:hypothetical protein n=1 Tax=Mesorhizobium sp. M1396 TaxID=2957095 RepID=UPI003337CBD1